MSKRMHVHKETLKSYKVSGHEVSITLSPKSINAWDAHIDLANTDGSKITRIDIEITKSALKQLSAALDALLQEMELDETEA